jgi:hypothetical protein
MDITKVADPYPHAILENVIPAELYSRLKFPEMRRRNNTRAGWDLFKGEKQYDEFFASNSDWKLVQQFLDSEQFIISVCRIFDDELLQQGVEIDKLKLIEFTETPAQMQMGHIAFGKFDHKIFSRFDLQASNGTTLRNPHVDHARRLIGGVLFFCDSAEEGMSGGDFGVWVDRKYRGDRKPHDCELVGTYPIRHNTLYVFLNRNDSFHAPTEVTAISGMRKWSYFSISARQNVWRTDPGALSLVQSAKSIVNDGMRYGKYHVSNWKSG